MYDPGKFRFALKRLLLFISFVAIALAFCISLVPRPEFVGWFAGLSARGAAGC